MANYKIFSGIPSIPHYDRFSNLPYIDTKIIIPYPGMMTIILSLMNSKILAVVPFSLLVWYQFWHGDDNTTTFYG